MSGRLTEIGYLIRFKPAEAKAKILAALRKAKANKGEASKLLACTHGTLCRWFDELAMQADVAALVAEAVAGGWAEIPKGGRPRGSLKRKPISGPKRKRGRPPTRRA